MQKYISCIYKITSPSGRIYVGQTVDFKRRMSDYKRLKCKTQIALYRSLIKYGFENHHIQILFSGSCDDVLLNDLEIEYIYVFNSFKNGLNQTLGGLGSRGRIASQYLKDAMSKRRKGAIASDETRLKMSIAKKGKKKPDGFGAKVSLRIKGTKQTDQHKLKHSLSKKGSIPFNRKKVIDNNTGIIYNSARELSEILSINYHTARGRIVSIFDQRFEYINKNNLQNSPTKKVICTKTGTIYNSIKECGDKNGINYSKIRAILGGYRRNKTTFIYA